MAVPRSGRRPFRPTANFSKPRDTSHGLSSNIKALGRLYHKGGGNRPRKTVNDVAGIKKENLGGTAAAQRRCLRIRYREKRFMASSIRSWAMRQAASAAR